MSALPLSYAVWSEQALLFSLPDQTAHPPSVPTASPASFTLHPSTVRWHY